MEAGRDISVGTMGGKEGGGVGLWLSVYAVSLSFVVHKNRKIKTLEGVGRARRHTDACVTSCSKASCFLAAVHQGIQAKPKHRHSSLQCNMSSEAG